MALREGPHCEKVCCTQLRPVGRALYDKLSRQVDWAEAVLTDDRESRAVRAAVAAVEILLADLLRLLCFSAAATITSCSVDDDIGKVEHERGLLRSCLCRDELSISNISAKSKLTRCQWSNFKSLRREATWRTKKISVA